ncbi:hypothetical protein [Paraburkholderia sp. BR14374]|uniref:hypothetical protein n=1 Tax=Paraburkholderia sp. BR14374 TaxID=3237007 RepID=UPI0034CD64C4
MNIDTQNIVATAQGIKQQSYQLNAIENASQYDSRTVNRIISIWRDNNAQALAYSIVHELSLVAVPCNSQCQAKVIEDTDATVASPATVKPTLNTVSTAKPKEKGPVDGSGTKSSRTLLKPFYYKY